MSVLKKILGVLMIIMAAFLSLGILAGLAGAISDILAELKKSAAEGFGYALGSLIGLALFGIICYFLFEFGFRMASGKPMRNKRSA